MGGGRGSTSIWRPDDVSLSRGTCWRASYRFEVFDPSCIIFWQSRPVYTKSEIQWHFPGEKESKPLGLAKHQEFFRAYRIVSKPTQDWKTVEKSSRWWGSQKIFLLFGKQRPSAEVKQWMLRSMCDDCPHKIFTHHVTNRSHNITRRNDPNSRAEQMSTPFETNPR